MQLGGASGSGGGPEPAAFGPPTELAAAEEEATFQREHDEDIALASALHHTDFEATEADDAALQRALLDSIITAAQQEAGREPEQPATEEQAGGSLWDYYL